jgi:hypothetical protein
MSRCTRPSALALVSLAAIGLAAATATADPPATGRITISPTMDPPGEVGGQAVPHDSRFKVRDADGNVVAEGGVDGAGDDHGNYQTANVDLPPGEYTVEVYYHTPGDRHAEGTRDYRGDQKVTVRPGRTSFHQVAIEPRTPAEHLADRMQDVEDQIREKEGEIENVEQDIANHRRNGEPVGESHTDMLEDLNEDLQGLRDRLRDMRERHAAMTGKKAPAQAAADAARDGATAGAKGAADAVRGLDVPRIPAPEGAGKPRPRGKY